MFEGFFGLKKKSLVEEVTNEGGEEQYSRTIEEMAQSAREYKEKQGQESVEVPIKYDNGIDWQNPEEMTDKKDGGIFSKDSQPTGGERAVNRGDT